MNKDGVFLAFDTSNYTTSCAACDGDGKVILSLKKLLPVAEGERGLRQSDALFHHTAALPAIIEEAAQTLSRREILAVGASERPRDKAGSYMPCFLAGVSAAKAAAAGAQSACFGFSHQCGHIAAALYSANREELYGKRFVAFHVSGGTTDVLLCEAGKNHPFEVTRIGGTLDINAGQAIDRAGVAMGLHFPCGAELEKLALDIVPGEKPRICVKGLDCNLSGIENKAAKLYNESGDRSAVAALVIDFVSRTLEKITENLLETYPDIPIVYAGGVMSCKIIRKRLEKYGSFAEPRFSSDNAAGVALLTRRAYKNL